jgi:hypothetical protein
MKNKRMSNAHQGMSIASKSHGINLGFRDLLSRFSLNVDPLLRLPILTQLRYGTGREEGLRETLNNSQPKKGFG